jgi:NAD-dependent deacetylase
MDGIREAAGLLVAHSPAAALTGAGVSAESGVPDFRSPGGIWDRYDPDEYATAEALAHDPDRTWRFFAELIELLRDARPNPAHLALAELEGVGVLRTVITQNIDGLHQKAGSRDVVEFHGGPGFVCMRCGAEASIGEEALRGAHAGRAPRHGCGGILRPAVVLFGEEIPPAAARRARDAVLGAGALLVVGTSAQVHPAAGLPDLARSRGAPIVEVNIEPTTLTPHASLSLRGKAGEVLPAIAREVSRLLRP